MKDYDTLLAENERLRELLEDHGICPDPEPDYVPTFGPPTLLEWRMQETFAKSAASCVQHITEKNALLRFLESPKWSKGEEQSMRIRLPNDYTVNRINH